MEGFEHIPLRILEDVKPKRRSCGKLPKRQNHYLGRDNPSKMTAEQSGIRIRGKIRLKFPEP